MVEDVMGEIFEEYPVGVGVGSEEVEGLRGGEVAGLHGVPLDFPDQVSA